MYNRMFSKTYRDINPLLRCKLSGFAAQLCSKLPEATIQKACSWADVCWKEKSFDDSQLSLGEMSSYVEGPVSLNNALSKGLSPSSDWSTRLLLLFISSHCCSKPKKYLGSGSKLREGKETIFLALGWSSP
ncbi:hypothetical protein J1N35_029707 [Gossypium stocksii]|uniref:Uncharacterized protein n=1 Tax=Gossypium stocksii TaxID=47602 RepID=A0A9D3ZTQ1_9ROSI|nr:hypothetical protein J1N35_029707 [Gossypium stocksii]